MSLDIYFAIPTSECECPECGNEFTEFDHVFDSNITHNLKPMAKEAGIDILWDYNLAGKKAWYLIDKLEMALDKMSARPEHYKQFDAKNGWGTYKDFVPFLEKLLEACHEYPQAVITISK